MRHPHPMRRKDRALPLNEAMEILEKGLHGILASSDAEGLPLATPLSYAVYNGALYFHCAKTGHKMENLAAQPEVSFCVVTEDNPAYNNDFTTLFKSAIVNGTAAVVDDPAEHRAALLAICEKYLPDHMDKAEASIAQTGAHTAVVRVRLDDVKGKSNMAR